MNASENLSFEFLDCLIKAYYRENKAYVATLLNFEAIEQAVLLMQNHFNNEDKLCNSHHAQIIKTVFGNAESITKNNCNFILGISPRTFFRYKTRYLSTFRNYLMQSLEDTQYRHENAEVYQ